MTFSVATWNVNSLRVRLPHLQEWLAANAIDAMVLQETKLPDVDFPAAELQALGWHTVCSGQRTYNGVAILSREPPLDVVAGIPGFEDEQRRVLAATVRGVRVIDVYVPTARRSAPRSSRTSCAGSRPCATTWRRNSRATSNWSCSGTSTSPPRTATCTIRKPGKARCT